MKTLFITICAVFISGQAFGQDYLIVFTKPKTKDGCGDMRYQKIEVKNKDDYWKQSEMLGKQHANESYKDYYVSSQEYAIVVESTGQFHSGSCTFKKYEFARGKKSLEEARKKIQEQYSKFGGLYASPPQEVSVFSSGIIKAEPSKSEKQLGDLNAKFLVYKNNDKK